MQLSGNADMDRPFIMWKKRHPRRIWRPFWYETAGETG